MDGLVKYLLDNSRPMTEAERDALNSYYKIFSTPTGRTLYNLKNEQHGSIKSIEPEDTQ